MVEKKVYYRHGGESSQRRGPLRVQSGQEQTELGLVRRRGSGREREERGTRCNSQETQRYKESGESKWLEYIGKGNPAPWTGMFRVDNRV